MPSATKQLLLSKYLFSRGVDALRPNDDLSAGVAVSLFHDATEMTMWEIAKQRSIKVSDKEAFTELLKKIAQFAHTHQLAPAVSEGMLLDINKVRVSYKHNGILPAHSAAVTCQGYAEESLRALMKAFFQVDFGSLSLAELISHEEVKSFIKTAELAFSNNLFEDCVVECAKAQHVAALPVDELIPFATDHFRFPIVKTRDYQDIVDPLSAYIDRVRLIALAALLKLSVPDLARFSRLAPDVDRAESGTFHVTLCRDHYTRGDAEFCLRYVVDYALTVERQLG